jgi:3-oxoacyl-[acyl-carrier protein] reductase
MARVALVTGGTRGIGNAISIALKHAGYRVAANYAGNDAAAQQFQVETGIPVFKWDVGNFAACEAGCAQVAKEVGPVDVLVNNAGITRDMLAMRLKDEDWDAVLDTNLKAVFRMSRAVMRTMMKQRYGRIISITSVVGASGNPGQANYAAAKAGVAGMTRALARELGSRGITVNCVAPGFIETDMTSTLPEEQRKALLGQIPLGHLGRPADVAHAVAYLASPQAGYVTGQEIHVNGGMYMS